MNTPLMKPQLRTGRCQRGVLAACLPLTMKLAPGIAFDVGMRLGRCPVMPLCDLVTHAKHAAFQLTRSPVDRAPIGRSGYPRIVRT